MKPYNKEEWQQITREWLIDRNAPSTALDAAYYALRRDDPDLAQDALEEAKRRRKGNSRPNAN
jgi:hypothetical protein